MLPSVHDVMNRRGALLHGHGLMRGRDGAEVEIWSGRSDEVKDKTTAWLAEHGLGHIKIRTRAAGDHRPDTVL